MPCLVASLLPAAEGRDASIAGLRDLDLVCARPDGQNDRECTHLLRVHQAIIVKLAPRPFTIPEHPSRFPENLAFRP